jgi:hypothetical protein
MYKIKGKMLADQRFKRCLLDIVLRYKKKLFVLWQLVLHSFNHVQQWCLKSSYVLFPWYNLSSLHAIHFHLVLKSLFFFSIFPAIWIYYSCILPGVFPGLQIVDRQRDVDNWYLIKC